MFIIALTAHRRFFGIKTRARRLFGAALFYLNMNIVIMAGGGGTRLWPVSREGLPKQFASLIGKRTLLQKTYGRALAVTKKKENIVVTTRDLYAKEVKRQLPKLPKKNILIEPVKRDTAPSVGVAAAFFAAHGGHDEPMLMLPSDHVIKNEKLFVKALKAAGKVMEKQAEKTVVLGATPTYPETGFGYIEQGKKSGQELGMTFFLVKRFTEKPNLVLAKKYLKTKRFFWNMGVYGWRTSTLLKHFHEFQPDVAKKLDRIQDLFARGSSQEAINKVYSRFPSISVDFAITENQDPRQIVVIPGAYEWSDVGHWASLSEILGALKGDERKQGCIVKIKSPRNFVYSDVPKIIGLVGVQDLIVVATKDALLICDKNNTQDVKVLVKELENQGHKKFL